MKKSRLPGRLKKMATVILFIYLGLLLLVYSLQRKFIYVPSHSSLENSTEFAREQGFELWSNNSGEAIGWKRLSHSVGPRAQLLIFHGNGGDATYVLDSANELLAEHSWDIYVLEYPGYGFRNGSPNEKDIFASARKGFELMKGGGPTYLLGISLGTGVACHLASEFKDEVKGLLLAAPYDSLVSVGKIRMPIFPVSLMQKDRFNSGLYLQNYNGPVAVIIGGRDIVIPNRLSRRLLGSYQGPKKLWEFPASGHNDLLPQPVAFWKDLLRFWAVTDDSSEIRKKSL